MLALIIDCAALTVSRYTLSNSSALVVLRKLVGF